MVPLHTEIVGIKYRRPGLTKIDFIAEYNGYTRRGTVIYDTVNKKFISHSGDINLLASVCTSLQAPVKREAGCLSE